MNPTTAIQPVHDPADIDITRHGLIEASAGTGKTYTIEHLVTRILMEQPGIGLDNILIVTFTEKATCELKARLYQRIDEAARHGAQGPVRDKLRDCLDGFDTAAIDTIHGFCNGLLQDFAFENQSLFQSQTANDNEIWNEALTEVMRHDWPVLFGADLETLLDIAGFSRRRTHFLQTVTAVARALRPQAGDILVPELENRDFTRLKAGLEAELDRLEALVDEGLVRGYAALNINAGTKKAVLEKVLDPLARFLAARQPGRPIDLFGLSRLVETMRGYGAFKDKGPAGLMPGKWLKKGANLSACPALEPAVKALDDLVAGCDRLSHFLALTTITLLPERVNRLKEDRGTIGFDDMLTRVWQALAGGSGDLLRQRLRARFAVAFVDEFQDTDPIQWRILEDVFLKAPGNANRLFLIGDPKQAIYAFRGADVYAYLEARNAMAELAAAGRAGLYRLEINWRSTACLVDAFNRVFAQPDWFGADSGAFGYSPSGCARRSGPEAAEPCLQILDLADAQSPLLARRAMARWCAEEIGRLVAEARISVMDKTGSRPIDFGDIAVLVRTRSEMPALERAFKAKAIAYSTYKKPGLFTCAQAHQLSWVLNAIAAPGQPCLVKKALLSPFFAIDPQQVYRLEALDPGTAAGRLLGQWVELARQRHWSRMFQSIEADSGFFFRQSVLADWSRIRANHRQIVEYLVTEARARNLDIRGLAALLETNRRQGGAEDADLHQIDAEGRKVQLMTVHVSKGLEFAVVFVAGGLTQKPYDNWHRFHRQDGPRYTRVIDIGTKADPAAHFAEQAAEDKRLFYVALTRASQRVYLPYYPVEETKTARGPLTGFGAKALAAAFDRSDGPNGRIWIKPGDAVPHARPPAIAGGLPLPADTSVLPGAIGDFRARRIRLASFSGLRSEPQRTFSLVDTPGRADDEPLKAEPPPPGADGAPVLLAGGAALGTALHAILESIDYARVLAVAPDLMGAADLADLIREELTANRLDPGLAPAVAALVTDTLGATIAVHGSPLVLGRLPRTDRLHEAEFCFPCPADQSRQFVRGAIDLIFRWQGRYFIADWKSNHLADGYGLESLAACMTAADYRLQYLIYAVAGLRFLTRRIAGFDMQRHFGGIFYFFLRGMGQGEGVYFVTPENLGSLPALEGRLAERLKSET